MSYHTESGSNEATQPHIGDAGTSLHGPLQRAIDKVDLATSIEDCLKRPRVRSEMITSPISLTHDILNALSSEAYIQQIIANIPKEFQDQLNQLKQVECEFDTTDLRIKYIPSTNTGGIDTVKLRDLHYSISVYSLPFFSSKCPEVTVQVSNYSEAELEGEFLELQLGKAECLNTATQPLFDGFKRAVEARSSYLAEKLKFVRSTVSHGPKDFISAMSSDFFLGQMVGNIENYDLSRLSGLEDVKVELKELAISNNSSGDDTVKRVLFKGDGLCFGTSEKVYFTSRKNQPRFHFLEVDEGGGDQNTAEGTKGIV